MKALFGPSGRFSKGKEASLEECCGEADLVAVAGRSLGWGLGTTWEASDCSSAGPGSGRG